MKAFQEIQSRLGLTQGELAKLLGVSRPLITMVDSNRRTLTTEACLKLALLEMTLFQDKKSGGQQAVTEIRDYGMKCTSREKKARARLHYLKNKLGIMARMHAQKTRLLSALKIMKRRGINDPTIEMMRKKAEKQVLSCCPVVREQLRIQIKLCMAESELLKQFRKKFLNPTYEHL